MVLPNIKPKKILPKIIKRRIDIASGRIKGSLLLRNARVVNVFSGEVLDTNILIDNKVICGIGNDYIKADHIIDISGLYALPGFIDAHLHIESSLLSLSEFARLLLISGTTTIVADPHEITNVLGTKGIDYILNASKDFPLDIFLTMPSCVPSTIMETAGGLISAQEINVYLKKERILGLAEMMNFPGVVYAFPDVIEKIVVAKQFEKIIDGHCPKLTGRLLQAYLSAGIVSDHESTDVKEAQEKLRSGMYIMIREGSAAKNLSSLYPLINLRNARRLMLVSDDKHPDELLSEGHLNAVLRKIVKLGIDPITAIQMVTLNPAEYFRLYNRGAIAPGKLADITVVDDLNDFNVKMVVKNGKIIVQNMQLMVKIPDYQDRRVFHTMKVRPFTKSALKVKAQDGKIKVIKIIPNQIITEMWLTNPKIIKKEVVPDFERDILKLVVCERHKKTGNIGVGFVSGFGLKKGALASSVSHDSHNIIAVGTNDDDIYYAIKSLIKLGGGFVAVDKEKIKASLPLPIAGLMSNEPAEIVSNKLKELIRIGKLWGVKIDNPFITLSFLALPVIPELKLTDKGLIDVNRFKIVPLWDK
ncbi:MAG: adenine deaminase [candidate division WOR-3 bacterium]|nr:adenine deaminase [candidate division WOR-3 bacterium]